MGLAFSVRHVLAEKRKGKPAISGDPTIDKAIWEIAEVLREIAMNGSAPEADQRVDAVINIAESPENENARE